MEALSWFDFTDHRWLGAPGGVINDAMDPKPVYHTLQRLIHTDWHTEEELFPSSDGLCRLRIPRQLDGSPRLEIDFLDSGEVRTFPVGEYILESGYDWDAADLKDISLEMDFSRSSLTFTISKWKKTLSYEITF